MKFIHGYEDEICTLGSSDEASFFDTYGLSGTPAYIPDVLDASHIGISGMPAYIPDVLDASHIGLGDYFKVSPASGMEGCGYNNMGALNLATALQTPRTAILTQNMSKVPKAATAKQAVIQKAIQRGAEEPGYIETVTKAGQIAMENRAASVPKEEGMSTTTKVAIGVAAVSILGGLLYFGTKAPKKKI